MKQFFRLKSYEYLGLGLVIAGLIAAYNKKGNSTQEAVPSPTPIASVLATPFATAETPTPSPIDEPEESPPAGRERLIFTPYSPDFDAWVAETRGDYDLFLDRLEARFERPTKKTIVVSFFKSRDTHFPSWGHGFFDGGVKISRQFLQKSPGKAKVVLKHEIVHAFLGPGWPTWLDEGLAEYLSCEGSFCEAFKFPPMQGSFAKKTELQQSFSSLSLNQAKRLYHHSKYFVLYLNRTYGATFWRDLALRAKGSPEREIYTMCSCTFDELLDEVTKAWQKRELP